MAKKLIIGTDEIIVPEKTDISSQIQAEGKGVPYGVTAGTASAYTLTISGISSYTTGMILAIKFHTSNNVNATINLNGLGAKSIYRNGTPIPTNMIDTNDVYLLTYDGTNLVFTDRGFMAGYSPLDLVGHAIEGVTTISSESGDPVIIVSGLSNNNNKITDVAKGTTTTDVATLENLADYVSKTDIVNNVTTTDATKPLSANQGKVLKDLVDTKANDSVVVKTSGNQSITGTKNFTGTLQFGGKTVATLDDITSVFKYKGSVASYANLPTTGQVIGDVWNVLDTGKNFAWDGTAWDDLSGIIDLSNYYTKSETNSLLDAKVTANAGITGATKTKITYDSKGLVTGGADLVASDIPNLDTAKITTGQFPLDRMPRSASGFLKAGGAGSNPSYATLVSADIPNLPASKITSETFADARIASASTWNAKVGEAPSDGKSYVRKDGVWVAVSVTTVSW